MRFNIKNYKKNLFIIITFTILFNFLINYLLQCYVDSKTTKNTFYENKRSKMKHYILNNQDQPKDYVFVGTSRTLYGISTEEFKSHKLNSYNFGISSTGITRYVSIVNQLTDIFPKPKHIVISIQVNDLYDGDSVYPNIDNTIQDFKYALQTKDPKTIYNSYQGILNNLKLSTNDRFLIKKDILKFIATQDNLNNKDLSKIKDLYEMLDCTPFIHNFFTTQSVHCTNGDGLLFNIYLQNTNEKNKVELKQFNKIYLSYLKMLIQDIENNNIIPIIILEPIVDKHLSYNVDTIYKILGKHHVINLTELKIPNYMWADPSHLNWYGREFYSKQLIEALQKNIL